MNIGSIQQILGIGSCNVDLAVEVDERFLELYGLAKGQFEIVDWPKFSKLPAHSKISPGGSSANCLRGLGKLGEKCAFFGKIGSDDKGKYFRDRLIAHAVAPILLESQAPTNQIACLITPDKERTPIVFLGAGQELAGTDVTEALFANTKLVHIDGYSLWNDGLFQQSLILAKKAGCLVSFDLGSAQDAQKHQALLLEMIPKYVDIIFGNEEEVIALTAGKGLNALARLCPVAVMKAGKDGCHVATQNQTVYAPAIPPKELVDTTGAGDFFASGFLYAYLRKQPLDACARFANLVASKCVEVLGVELPDDTWETLRQEAAPW